MKSKSSAVWLGLVCVTLFVLTLVLVRHSAFSQTRDEETAKEVEKINPLKPAADATKTVIDNTVNKILPIDIPTDSKLVQDEKACYDSCAQQKARSLKNSVNDVDRGHAWTAYRQCKSDCPEKVANKNRSTERDPFTKEERYPAGSTMGGGH